jgi:predicted Zn-dependent protease
MLDQSRAEAIFDKVRKYASVPEVEVIFSSTNFSLTRFANNTIHQNVAELNEVASIRVAFDGKTARAATNRFDDAGLKRAVQSAEQMAKAQETDPDLLPMASAADGTGTEPPSRWFDQTAALTPADRAEGVAKIVNAAKKNKLVTAGIFSSSQSAEAVVNSKGLSVYHRQTSAEVHRDSGTLGGARPGGLHVLGLWRAGDSGPAFISQQSYWIEAFWRKHHHRR